MSSKTKSMTDWVAHVFLSLAPVKYIFPSSYECFNRLSTFVMFDQSNYFGVGFTTLN